MKIAKLRSDYDPNMFYRYSEFYYMRGKILA